MSFVMAISGKGGSGKTTVAALMVKWLLARGDGPVFAVDADPNSNFADQLGVPEIGSVGDMREELLKNKNSLPASMSKADFIAYRLQEVLVEAKGFDLLTMGRPEGPGCYCYLNSLLREYLDSRAKNYRYVVIDNEAGMEHLSRRTTRDVDVLLVVSDLTTVSLMAAFRIGRLARSLELRIGRIGLLLNKTDKVPAAVADRIAESGLTLLGTIPADRQVADRSLEGLPLIDMEERSPAYGAVSEACSRIVAPAGVGDGVERKLTAAGQGASG